MDRKFFSIGEISRIKGITRKALRFYEKIGLLVPYRVDPSNGYRYYSPEQFVSIDIIKAMRIMDISPHGIKTVMDGKDTGALLDFLESEKRKAARRVLELTNTMERIDEIRNAIRTSRQSVSHPGVYRRQIPERRVVTLPFEGITDRREAEIRYSRFDGLISGYGLVNTYESGILFREEGGAFVPSRIFNAVRAAEGSNLSDTSLIPEGNYVCIWYTQNDAEKRGEEMTRYCSVNGITPELVVQADLLCDIFVTDTPAVELQILAREER